MDEEEGGSERRRDYRLSRVFGAEIDDSLHVRLFVINISASGFRATCNTPIPVQENLRIKLKWDAREPIFNTVCRVAWQRELSLSGMFELGFEFTSLADDDWPRLVQLIEAERTRAPGRKSLDLKSFGAHLDII
jgi:hypothetical protein